MIYYTTDGSDPTTASTRYTGTAIAVNSTTTIKAIAVKGGMNDSAVLTAAYIITTPRAAAPVATPEGGAYNGAQSVTLTSATPEALIYYTLDGSEPTTESTPYTGAIAVSASKTIKAIAVKEDMDDSEVLSAVYTITLPPAAAPTATPGGGEYDEAQSVTLTSATQDALIYYTLDGSEPTTESTPYTGAIAVSASKTIKAIAVKEGMADSELMTEKYTISSRANDAEDFPGEEIDRVFDDVASTNTWEDVMWEIQRGGNDKNYVINITENFEVGRSSSSSSSMFYPVTGLRVSIRGDHTLSANDTILWINEEQTVIVRDVDFTSTGGAPVIDLTAGELTLRGSASVSGNTVSSSSLKNGGGVSVTGTGTFIMRDRATISGNTSRTGGGVYVAGNGTFIMSDDAVVSNNTATSGGGVAVINSGTFTMSGSAVISNNTVNTVGNGMGGGVYVKDPTAAFTMEGGVISDNTASYGGGVCVSNGTFTMEGGVVSGNTVTQEGGGVYGEYSATLTIKGSAEVRDNTSASSGGGVCADGTFTLEGSAKVSGNTSAFFGGGVFVGGEIFTMSGSAVVSNNTVENGSGGGVYANGTFTMLDNAVISDNNASDSGGGVYANGTFTMEGSAKIRDNTTSVSGGGVYVFLIDFTMKGSAAVSGNTAAENGGGVYVYSAGTFTMLEAAMVSNNKALSGGGVCADGTFIMSDSAVISDNEVTEFGGGVYVYQGTLIMEGSAELRGNTAAEGGGVFVNNIFTMRDTAVISDNTASSGGGVYTYGISTMEDDAEIRGNIAGISGGGVHIYGEADYWYGGSFQIVSGTVYGSNAGADSNKVIDVNGDPLTGSGAALYKADDNGKAEYGTLNASDTFVPTDPQDPLLDTTDDTIEVINGVLQ